MRGGSWWTMLLAVLAGAAAAAATGTSAGSADHVDARTEARLRGLLGTQRLLRDAAAFTTERGEPAWLLLFVTGMAAPTVPNFAEPLSCPEAAAGIGLPGTYHVGLVRDGRLINEVVIPCSENADCVATDAISFPLANTRFDNYVYWGQGAAIDFRRPRRGDRRSDEAHCARRLHRRRPCLGVPPCRAWRSVRSHRDAARRL